MATTKKKPTKRKMPTGVEWERMGKQYIKDAVKENAAVMKNREARRRSTNPEGSIRKNPKRAINNNLLDTHSRLDLRDAKEFGNAMIKLGKSKQTWDGSKKKKKSRMK